MTYGTYTTYTVINIYVKCMAMWGEPGAMIDACTYAYTYH